MFKRRTGIHHLASGNGRGYVIAGLAGAGAGAATVALATNAVPKLMQRMMEL
jgi:hypothetical protein